MFKQIIVIETLYYTAQQQNVVELEFETEQT